MSTAYEKQEAHAWLDRHARGSNLTVGEAMRICPEHWRSYLEERLAIKVTESGDGRASLKYNQQESPMELLIVRQCRGMVVDLERRTVLAHPFDKFWNYGEPHADTLDWGSTYAQEKLDGSLMILYRWFTEDGGTWHVASSGHPTAGGPFNATDYTFAEAFWEAFHDDHMQTPRTHKRLCFMFELVGPDNRIVVNYFMPRVILTGARDLDSGRELSRAELVEIAIAHNWPIVEQREVTSVADAIAWANARGPTEAEGFVIVDAQHRRVKVKSAAYVAAHALRGEFTTRRAVELWQTGEASEVLAIFPEFRAKIEAVHGILDGACQRALIAYQQFGGLERKAFAAEIKHMCWSAIAFRLLAGPTPTLADAKRIGRGLTTNALENIVKTAELEATRDYGLAIKTGARVDDV